MEKSGSQRFRDRISFGLPAAIGAYQRRAAAGDFHKVFPSYLTSVYSIVRASVPLMEFGLSLASRQADKDPVCRELSDYFEKHIPEERSHDEWLLEDIEALGIPRALTQSRLPAINVAAMVGAQYYWMQFAHPIALLGYIGVVEGAPPSCPALEELIVKHRLPRRSFRTLFVHAKLDPGHKEDLDVLLDRLDLEKGLEDLVCLSAVSTLCHLTEIFESLQATATELRPEMHDSDRSGLLSETA